MHNCASTTTTSYSALSILRNRWGLEKLVRYCESPLNRESLKLAFIQKKDEGNSSKTRVFNENTEKALTEDFHNKDQTIQIISSYKTEFLMKRDIGHHSMHTKLR